jgi:VIT1/CCC1 family predicted Fe2+/Mn2+ transporter
MIHQEEHFQGSETVRDVVIGMADGLTVPFALAAGISGAVNAVNAAHIVVTAGIAEIAAGSVAMGLGGYLAARSEVEHYHSELKREEQEIVDVPHVEEREITDIFKAYGLTDTEVEPVVAGLRRNPQAWRDFMMKFELGLEEPDPKRAMQCAATIAISYVVGGLVPLAPYMILNDSKTALGWSIMVTLMALAVFGFVKGHFTGVSRLRSGLQTVVVGGLAAAVAFYLARLFS